MLLRRRRRALLICVAAVSLLGFMYHMMSPRSSKSTDTQQKVHSVHAEGEAEEGLVRFRRLLEDYTPYHKSWATAVKSGEKSNLPVLVFTCPETSCDKIGDLVYGIVTTFLLAVFSDRVFVIDSHVSSLAPTQLARYLVVNKIDWGVDVSPSSVQRFDFSEGNKNLHEDSTKALAAILSRGEQYVALANSLKPDDLFSPFFDQDALEKLLLKKGDRQSMDNLRDVLWEHRWMFMQTAVEYLFHFSKDVTSRALQIQNDVNLFGMYSAVHIRTGLGMSEDDILHHRLQRLGMEHEDMWNFMIKCSKTVSDKKMGHALAVYVSSDSVKVKDWLSENTVDHAVFSDVLLDSSMDQSKDAQEVEDNVHKTMLDAWTEIFILSKAKIFLMSPLSRFSEMAVYFRSHHFGSEYVYSFPYHEECGN